MTSRKIAELLELVALEGITLPLPPETIVALEATGAVVDLNTGAILRGGANHRFRLTLLGEANAVVLNKEYGE